jgi:hypothetical protein
MKLKTYIFFLFALFAGLQANAQVEVHAVLDSNSIRIGEQTRLDVYLRYDATTQKKLDIQWPVIEDTLKKEIEVVNITKIDTFPDKANPNIVQQHLQITITSFDSGYYAIPPFKFILNKDTAHPLVTEPLLLAVNTMPTDTALAKIRDIKPPYDEPFDWRWYLPYAYWSLGVIAAAIILIIILVRLSKRKQVEEVPVDDTPKIPPHVTAFESLEKIKAEAVWKENRTKEYYSSIADTIRLYIEERFKINALELTSDEILHIFKSQVVDTDSKHKLYQILTLSDFVKFAKQIPIEAEHTLTLNNAFEFVNGTLREEPVVIPNEPSKTTNDI